MTVSHQATLIGVFEHRDQADRAVEELRRAGFRENQLGVVGRNDTQTTDATAATHGSHTGSGAAVGAALGAGVGGLVGLGILAGVIPVIGPIIAGGALATILANAAGGAVIAGIAGALAGLGIPEEEAHYYEGEVKSGRIVVTVKADGRSAEAWTILQRHGAYNRTTAPVAGVRASTASSVAAATGPNVGMPSRSPAGSATSAGASTGDQTIQLHEEELRARKQPVQTGEVRVHKEVVTEQKTLNVPVQREEVVIERRPVGNQAASSTDIREGQEIRIPVSEEQVRVEKQTVVKEEVRVGKRQVQGTEQVSGTVRKEEARVEREGNVDIHGGEPKDVGRMPKGKK